MIKQSERKIQPTQQSKKREKAKCDNFEHNGSNWTEGLNWSFDDIKQQTSMGWLFHQTKTSKSPSPDNISAADQLCLFSHLMFKCSLEQQKVSKAVAKIKSF